jgi:hypothetical protein
MYNWGDATSLQDYFLHGEYGSESVGASWLTRTILHTFLAGVPCRAGSHHRSTLVRCRLHDTTWILRPRQPAESVTHILPFLSIRAPRDVAAPKLSSERVRGAAAPDQRVRASIVCHSPDATLTTYFAGGLRFCGGVLRGLAVKRHCVAGRAP